MIEIHLNNIFFVKIECIYITKFCLKIECIYITKFCLKIECIYLYNNVGKNI
jgi:hypothetical protein